MQFSDITKLEVKKVKKSNSQRGQNYGFFDFLDHWMIEHQILFLILWHKVN